MKQLAQNRIICAVLGLALGSLALALLCWALSSPPRASALRLLESQLDEPPPASGPNPRCGVAGAQPIHLQALSLSIGSPEPGGYAYVGLVGGNGVQLMGPCKVYADPPPSYCYDETPGTVRNEVAFTNWITQHPGMVWLIGNEPDIIEQNNLTPTQYAKMYHDYYNLIKDADPTAQIATAGFSQIGGTVYADAVLTAYEELYTETMPVDVWNFHYYNVADYSVDSVKGPMNSWIGWIRTTREGIYADTPIWLTEWGRLDGWDPDCGLRGDQDPTNDCQDPRLVSLMLSWAQWMESEGKIDRWFWFVTQMGDWGFVGNGLDAELDMTGWLFQEQTDYFTGIADGGTITMLVDADLPPPTHSGNWINATLYVNELNQGRRVTDYNSGAHTLMVTSEFSPAIDSGDTYRLAKWTYSPLTPNFLGVAYKCYCNPSACLHQYLPLAVKDSASARAGAASAGSLQAPLSPLAPPTLIPTLAPLPTLTPSRPRAIEGGVLIDDFEYADSPTAHGWYVLSGAGALQTYWYKSKSTRLRASAPGAVPADLSFTYPGDPAAGQELAVAYPFLSFEVADRDGWWVDVEAQGSDGQKYHLLYKPEFGPPSTYVQDGRVYVQHNIGRGYVADGWHTFGRDLDADLRSVVSGVRLTYVRRLAFSGVEYLDNVILQEPPFPSDSTPPTTALHREGTMGAGGWYTSPVRISLAATDDQAGVSFSAWRLDGRMWLTYPGFHSLVEAEGYHLLEAYSVDRAGNVEEVTSAAFWIDRTQPEVEFVEPLASVYTRGTQFRVSYKADDTASGIKRVVATLDGKAVANGQVIDTLFLSPGQHTLVVTATDLAGWETNKEWTFEIDQ